MGGKTSNASKAKYNAKAYDRINIAVPKGEKTEIQIAAGLAGQSVNAYVNQAIREKMERDAQESNALPTDGQSDAQQDAPCGGGEELPTETETPVNGL